MSAMIAEIRERKRYMASMYPSIGISVWRSGYLKVGNNLYNMKQVRLIRIDVEIDSHIHIDMALDDDNYHFEFPPQENFTIADYTEDNVRQHIYVLMSEAIKWK